MSAGTRKKDQERAAYLVKIGYPHGRRMTKGLDNVPKVGETGSAAYRRLQASKKGSKQLTA